MWQARGCTRSWLFAPRQPTGKWNDPTQNRRPVTTSRLDIADPAEVHAGTTSTSLSPQPGCRHSVSTAIHGPFLAKAEANNAARMKLSLDELTVLDDFPLALDAPFTTAQARSQGITPNQLTRLTEAGFLRRILRGVYVATQVPDTRQLRAAALRLVVPANAVVTDRTAGWLLGARRIDAPNAHLEIPPLSVFSTRAGLRLRNDLCVSGERRLLKQDITEIDGVRVTTPLRTACDLGRLLHRDQAIAALDSLSRLRAFSRDELVAEIGRFRGYRGVRTLRPLAHLVDGRSESPSESVLRLRWLDCPSLPKPEPQVPVAGPNGTTYWLDLGVEELRFGAEYDGAEFHSSDEDRAHDEDRRNWMRRNLGWTIEVFRRESIYGQHQDVQERLRAGIRTARRQLGVNFCRVEDGAA
jgi:hypothetical protein